MAKKTGINFHTELRIDNLQAEMARIKRTTPTEGTLFQDDTQDVTKECPQLRLDFLGTSAVWSHKLQQWLPVLDQPRLLRSLMFPRVGDDASAEDQAYRLIRYEALKAAGAWTSPVLWQSLNNMTNALRANLRRIHKVKAGEPLKLAVTWKRQTPGQDFIESVPLQTLTDGISGEELLELFKYHELPLPNNKRGNRLPALAQHARTILQAKTLSQVNITSLPLSVIASQKIGEQLETWRHIRPKGFDPTDPPPEYAEIITDMAGDGGWTNLTRKKGDKLSPEQKALRMNIMQGLAEVSGLADAMSTPISPNTHSTHEREKDFEAASNPIASRHIRRVNKDSTTKEVTRYNRKVREAKRPIGSAEKPRAKSVNPSATGSRRVAKGGGETRPHPRKPRKTKPIHTRKGYEFDSE
nr:RNA-dependent RNA polymerase [Flumine birnavirus]